MGPVEVVDRLLATLDAERAPREREGGTLCECSLVGVHVHSFRGPHRFREWDPDGSAAINELREAKP
jgi:hypothetical protein